MQQPDLITIERAAEFLQVSPRAIRRWIAEKRLRAYRVGKRAIRIDYEDLRDFCRPIH